MTLLRLTAPYFTAGLVLVNGTVAQAAPILRWMRGRSEGQVRAYCHRKGWEVETVECGG